MQDILMKIQYFIGQRLCKTNQNHSVIESFPLIDAFKVCLLAACYVYYGLIISTIIDRGKFDRRGGNINSEERVLHFYDFYSLNLNAIPFGIFRRKFNY